MELSPQALMTMAHNALYNVLTAKLAVIDRECESSARGEIDFLYSQATYHCGRFQSPSLHEVSSVWLRLISRKEKEFCAEIARILATAKPPPDDEFFTQGMKLIEGYMDEQHYLNRLIVFGDGLCRKAASYGLALDPHTYRSDHAMALYETGVKNSLRNACTNIFAELAHHNQGTPPSGVWREGVLAINESLELKPNIMGIGLNLNSIVKRLFRGKN